MRRLGWGGGDLASINQYRWTAHSLDVLRLPPYIAISSVHHRPAAASHRGSECIGRRQRPTLKDALGGFIGYKPPDTLRYLQ